MDNKNPSKDADGSIRVAVKKLFSLDQKPANQEARTLEMMRGLQTDHLIKAVAYYRYDDKHHFMFPWAEHGNLWEFWTNTKGLSLEKPCLIWVFSQLVGLADGIEKLYHQPQIGSCRHEDLKPKNTLCFKHGSNGDSPVPAIRLVITDVGLAKSHSERTGSRRSTNTKAATKRYAGPEVEVNPGQPLSRRFDVWSLGCVFLEFAIWILYGGDELIRCAHGNPSAFYKIRRDENGSVAMAEVNLIVQGWVLYMRKDWRCSKGTALERLASLIGDKLLIVSVQGLAGLPSSVQSSEQTRSRPYVPEMRIELENILRDLETGTIDAVGQPLSDDQPTPRGPSNSKGTGTRSQRDAVVASEVGTILFSIKQE